MTLRKGVLKRIGQRLAGPARRGTILAGFLLGLGALPCPECGAPMILHFWPVAAIVLLAQALKRRHTKPPPSEVVEGANPHAASADHRGE